MAVTRVDKVSSNKKKSGMMVMASISKLSTSGSRVSAGSGSGAVSDRGSDRVSDRVSGTVSGRARNQGGASTSSSSSFKNPFSLSAPNASGAPVKSLSTSAPSTTATVTATATQSTLKTITTRPLSHNSTASKMKKFTPAASRMTMTDTVSDAPKLTDSLQKVSCGTKRKITTFFSNSKSKATLHTDDPNIAQKKENISIQGEIEHVHGDDICEEQDGAKKVLKCPNRLSSTLKSISAIDVSSTELILVECDDDMDIGMSRNAADGVVGRHDMSSLNDADNKAGNFEHEVKLEEIEEIEVVEEEEELGVREYKAVVTSEPYMIPNLLSPTYSADERRKADSLRSSGVVRNKISPFTQDVRHFSHSARQSLGLTHSRMTSLVGRRMHAVAAPAGEVELLNSPRETRYGTSTTRRGGVTCVKFDKDGVLCAVGSSNGVLRVYDFDEVTYALQLNNNKELICDPEGTVDGGTLRVHPMVHFTGPSRDISDICWLPSLAENDIGEEDEVAVAFTYSPMINIYDLNTLEKTHHLVPFQADRSSGNCCILCLESPSVRTHSRFNTLLAGGGTGMIRRWNLPILSSTNDIKPEWEVLADPLSKSGGHCAVVSVLQSRTCPNIITTVTKQGIVVQWDINKLSAQSFAANATPVSLRRIVVSEGPVAGAAFVGRGHSFNKIATLGNRKGIKTHDQESLLCLTISGGSVAIYDIEEQVLLENVHCPRTGSTADIISTTVNDGGDGNFVVEAPPMLHCPVVFSESTGKQLFFTGSPASNHVNLVRLGGSICTLKDVPRDHTYRHQLKILQQQHLRYADAVSYLEHLRPATLVDARGSRGCDYERYISQQMATMCLSCKPMMQRCSRICHTLDAHIVDAIPGSNRIVTSQDLTFYLCATGHENRNGPPVVHTTDTKRDASISGMLNGNKSSVLHIVVMSSDSVETMCYTVDVIYGCEISLDKPYKGPPITGGLPKSIIRTNLQPKPPPTEQAPGVAVHYHTNRTVEESTGRGGEHIAQVSLTARVTAIEAHPCSPHVVVGCLDDSVVVLSAEASLNEV